MDSGPSYDVSAAGGLVQWFPNWGALALGGAERYDVPGLLAKGADFTTDLQKQSPCSSLFTFSASYSGSISDIVNLCDDNSNNVKNRQLES